MLGEPIDAAEAYRLGLALRVVPHEKLLDEANAFAQKIAAKPRVAVAMGKQLFYRQLEKGIAAAYDDAGQTMACNMMDESALEGVQAFIEKRPPRW